MKPARSPLLERHDPKVRRLPFHRSRRDPALVLRERALKLFAWRRRIELGFEEHGPVSLGQNKHFTLRVCPPGSFRERSHAEISQLAPLQLGGSLD